MSSLKTLIALDEDNATLQAIETITSPSFKVVATRSAERALNVLRTDPSAAILVVAQILGNTRGVTVLSAAQTLRPEVRRVLTATTDELSSLIEALHSGAVQRIVYKPLRPRELMAAITSPAPARAASA